LAEGLSGVTVTAINQIGHGKAADWDGVSDLHAAATAAAVRMAEALGQGQPIDVMGHSFGGTVALRVALTRPDLVRSLMETSRPEAEQRLRRNLALRALATAEKIEVTAADLEAKLREVSRGLSDTASIDPNRLRQAVGDDLLRDALLTWLETNSTVTEKATADAETQDIRSAKDAT
jgi:pimeloyl-ACP methyl ester carboxylesterase